MIFIKYESIDALFSIVPTDEGPMQDSRATW